MLTHQYFIYIMSSTNRTLYIGMTNDLRKRVYQHQHGLVEGFTSRYHIDQLVYYETTDDVQAALAREKQLKGFRRSKKVELIEKQNPGWENLSTRL